MKSGRNSILLASVTITVIMTASLSANMIYNGDFEFGVAGFSTDYSYVVPAYDALWPEATYTVYTNTNASGWVHHLWTDYGDHTSGSGQMMICNGQDPEAGPQQSLVWGQDVVVAPSTLYDFSVWIAPSYPEAYPALQVSINGDVIGTAVAPVGTNPGEWYQFTAQWTSGVGGTVAIEIRDILSIHTGNDFTIDDISLVPEPGTVLLLGLGGLLLRKRK